tara:strand:- start:910 stop:1086 length:177 start_codon:yes stop_codon:yes gene_type:complete
MSDTKILEEIMASLELAAHHAQAVSNLTLRKYIENTLRTAYEDLQVEVSAKLDNWQVV